MTQTEIRQKIIAHCQKTGLKIPSIGSENHPNPFPIKSRTIIKIFYNGKVCEGTLAILELFFKENNA